MAAYCRQAVYDKIFHVFWGKTNAVFLMALQGKTFRTAAGKCFRGKNLSKRPQGERRSRFPITSILRQLQAGCVSVCVSICVCFCVCLSMQILRSPTKPTPKVCRANSDAYINHCHWHRYKDTHTHTHIQLADDDLVALISAKWDALLSTLFNEKLNVNGRQSPDLMHFV